MKRIWIHIGLALIGLVALPAGAHHSFTAVYRPDETVQIEGKVVQFLFRNPHSILQAGAGRPSGSAREKSSRR